MARFNLVKIRIYQNTIIKWRCIHFGQNVYYCLFIVLKVIKMMFHIGTKNIISNFHQIEPTHGRDAMCVSGTEPRYVVPQ